MSQIDQFVRMRQRVLRLLVCVLALGSASPALAANASNPEEVAANAICTDDTQCGRGRLCQAGDCVRGCRIAGAFYAARAVNPANPCESCRPLRSTGDWSGWGNRKCDDGNTCTERDRCRAGVCTGRRSENCPVADQCDQMPNGASCDDGNACTQTDTCQAGVCTGGSTTTCTAADQCHDPGTCNPATGICSDPAKADGATCSDGNACSQTDTCQAGVCSGANPKTCAASDQCHAAGTCDAATGVCSNPAKANGAACSDGNACSQTDTCQAGVCSGANPKTCAASDQCHAAGTCDAATGICSNPPKANGATCSDGNACTQTDTCQAGVCSGANPKTCAASDQCHDAGTCNAATGVCSNPPKANGATCSDGNACSQTDTCQAGVCSGANPKTCTASDQCHAAGTCDAATGMCSNPPKANGAACSDGNACTQTDTCQAGVCSGANPKTCTPLDQCHDPGTCNPANGVCSNSVKADGAACNDGDLCTTGDTCQAGACRAGAPVDCEDEEGCTVRACDPATGTCRDTGVKPELSSCEDGDFCTVNDRCFCGICSPGDQRWCPADADPNTIDTCDTASQQCVHRGVVGPGRCLPGSCPVGSLCCPTDSVRACAPPGESCEGPVCGDAVCDRRSDGRSECCNGVCCGDGFVCENNSRCVPQNYDETAACSEGTADCCGGQCCPHGSFCHPTTHECLQACIDTFCPAGTTCCPTSTNKTCCDADEACFSPNDIMKPICTKKPDCVAGQTYVPSVNSCCANVGVCNDAQGEPAACCNTALQMCNTTTGTCEPL